MEEKEKLRQAERMWRRFDLMFTDQKQIDALYVLLDRLEMTRFELALIVMGLRVRPGFELKDFDI